MAPARKGTYNQNRCACKRRSIVERRQTTQSQISAVRVPFECKTENRGNLAVVDQRCNDRIIHDLRLQRVVGGVGPLVCAGEERIRKSDEAAGHFVTEPVRIVDESNFLVVCSDSGDGDVFVPEGAVYNLAITVLEAEVLVDNCAFVKSAVEDGAEVAIGFLEWNSQLVRPVFDHSQNIKSPLSWKHSTQLTS